MTEPSNPRDDAALEAFFADARATAPVPSEALVERILADAAAAQVRPAPAPTPSRRNWLSELVSTIGGWPAVAGLSAAAAAGVWIGVAAPGPLETWTTEMLGAAYDYSALTPGMAQILAEG